MIKDKVEDNMKLVKFEDLATGFDYGMNASAIEYDGKNKYIRITDIEENSGIYDPSTFVSPDGALSDKYLVNEGDILLARTGASVGKSYLNKEKVDDLYFAGFLIRASVTNAYPYYVYQFLQTERYNKFVLVNSARSGQPGLNAEEYRKLEIPIPNTMEKQIKIGKLLSSIDKLIEYNEKLVIEKKSSKSYYLNKLFNDKVEDDKIRVKLGDISILKSGGTPKSTNKRFYEGKIRFLSISDLNGKYLYETKKLISIDAIENSSSWIVPSGTLVYTMYASPAIPFILMNDIAIPQSVIAITLQKNINIDFIYYQLQYMYDEVMNLTMTGTQANISGEVVRNLKLNLPILENQQEIGTLLSSIDNVINMYEDKVLELKLKKKYYLNQIFN